MDANLVFVAVVQFLLVLMAIAIHESAHAWVADLCGDSTARNLGRLTLNPLPHLEPFGSVLLPGVLIALGMPAPFGWGRPAPWSSQSLRRPGWDDLLVAAAGPAANLLVSTLALIGVAFAADALGPEARQAGQFLLLRQVDKAAHLAGFPIVFTLIQAVWINALIGLFNLIPFPPLDGGQIALQLLPPDWGARLAALRPYGFMIGIVLVVFAMPLLLAPVYIILTIVLNAVIVSP
jgi:Zn-dependent protease